MKKILHVFTLFPLVAQSADMTLAANVHGLPEDFRQYFYNSELIVQVYLNDTRLFDAQIALKEDGGIRLLSTIDDAPDTDLDTRELWKSELKKGISLGKCQVDCPSGLMEVQYRLDNSVLKLFTSTYETAKNKSDYITMPKEIPNGVIMYNDISVTNAASSRSWGLNSSLTSSYAGWSQKVSFQSSGSDGEYHYISSSLYELYTQKELRGGFIRLGFFPPESDTGNVQTSGFGYDTVVGAMWGTSDALLMNTDSVSAWPVYINGRNQSIAEVWRDGRLIHTQQLQTGVQALDTRQLPGGIYDITIKIIENGHTVETQQAQIYKLQGWGNQDKRWRANIWSGQIKTLAIGDDRYDDKTPLAIGGGIDALMHPRAVIGFSGIATNSEIQARIRTDLTLSPNDALFAQYTLGNTEVHITKNTDIRYIHNITGGSSGSLFWRSTTTDIYDHSITTPQHGNTWGSSLSLRLPWSTSLIMNGQFIDTSSRHGFGADISVTTLATLLNHDTNFKLSAYDRPGFDDNSHDYGISFGVNMSLTPTAQHTVSIESGMNQDHNYSSLSYQWQSEGYNNIRTLGGSVSYSPQNTITAGNVSIDTPYISGDAYAQHNSQGSSNTAGGNLSQVLIIGGGKAASVNGNISRSMESALIVDVVTNGESAEIVASGGMNETKLKTGRNIVPEELWKKDTVQFSSSGGDNVHIFPSSDNVQMQRGSVKYIKINAIKTQTIVGVLKDEDGVVLKNRFVSSDISNGMINSEGVLTLDSGISNRELVIRAEGKNAEMHCKLPSDMDKNKTVQFVSTVICRPRIKE